MWTSDLAVMLIAGVPLIVGLSGAGAASGEAAVEAAIVATSGVGAGADSGGTAAAAAAPSSSAAAVAAPGDGKTVIEAARSRPGIVATFSIVAADTDTGEVGVAVASRFFAVGSVVPWARADVGAVATQATANTSYGPRGLDLLAAGLSPEEALAVLKRTDADISQRQVGIVAADGRSVTYTGPKCNSWAGGRAGKNFAVQGNILTGEAVVAALEKTFLETRGDLAQRLYAALVAGDAAGGDSRGRQSAALYVARAHAGYGGFNDRAIDVRVDDHADPIKELGRLTTMARMNDAWNRGWTFFTQRKFAEALLWQEKTAAMAPDNPEVLYDLAVIRLAAGKKAEALDALRTAVTANPKLRAQAKSDKDLDALRGDAAFEALLN